MLNRDEYKFWKEWTNYCQVRMRERKGYKNCL